MTTPTDELRTAAALLRDRATAAIHEGRTRWATGHTLGSRSPVVVDDPEQPSVLIETYAARLESVNRYLALLGPATGLALADWLNAADAADHHALVVARQILGEEGPKGLNTETAPLTADERQFLTFALDLAADQIASRGDEFTDEDHAALERLRFMADEAQPETEAHQHVWATVPAKGAYGRLIRHTWTYCGICGQPPSTNQPDDAAAEEPDTDPAARDGACSLCEVVKPSAYALRDHVMNVHPDEFCGIYHDHPAAAPAVTEEPK